jgi:hypothetical protein
MKDPARRESAAIRWQVLTALITYCDDSLAECNKAVTRADSRVTGADA